MVTLPHAFRALLLSLFLGMTLTAHAGRDEDQATLAAKTFVKDYFTKGYREYFQRSAIVTPAAKAALKKMETAARQKDPESGLDHDPVAQAQDYAENYSVTKVVVKGDAATAQAVAVGWPAIPLWLVRGKSGWLIDGAGEINPRGGR